MIDREELREKEGSVSLDLDFTKVFGFTLFLVGLTSFLVMPSLSFLVFYFFIGFIIAKWILPSGKQTTGRLIVFSVFGPTSFVPVLLLKNYYDFMNVDEED